ncbi:hypothetical protein DPMN_193972 [Dreissena polymorpha]|uniref:Uncharacterized protein n=1 Tax=Dreissena polymorpha TaxID=45954 RepID=A0A9D4B7J3_DREPO|nr:hypothetical protein DPMN_193972 [Dreissena polymorpha]
MHMDDQGINTAVPEPIRQLHGSTNPYAAIVTEQHDRYTVHVPDRAVYDPCWDLY